MAISRCMDIMKCCEFLHGLLSTHPSNLAAPSKWITMLVFSGFFKLYIPKMFFLLQVLQTKLGPDPILKVFVDGIICRLFAYVPRVIF